MNTNNITNMACPEGTRATPPFYYRKPNSPAYMEQGMIPCVNRRFISICTLSFLHIRCPWLCEFLPIPWESCEETTWLGILVLLNAVFALKIRHVPTVTRSICNYPCDIIRGMGTVKAKGILGP